MNQTYSAPRPASKRGRSVLPGLALLLLTLKPETGLAAGGAFAVEDAEIGKPGDCKVESWASFATNHNLVAVTSPACVVNFGMPVEVGGQFERSRADSVWETTGVLKGKANLIPVEGHAFGLAIMGGGIWDLRTGASNGGFINVPVTFQVRENVRINLNGGWHYDRADRTHSAIWGASVEWNFVKPVTLIAEVYGEYGNLPLAEEGEAPTARATREPRAQIGLRITPHDNVDIDLIWGHNIRGENAHWMTVGLNLRF